MRTKEWTIASVVNDFAAVAYDKKNIPHGDMDEYASRMHDLVMVGTYLDIIFRSARLFDADLSYEDVTDSLINFILPVWTETGCIECTLEDVHRIVLQHMRKTKKTIKPPSYFKRRTK